MYTEDRWKDFGPMGHGSGNNGRPPLKDKTIPTIDFIFIVYSLIYFTFILAFITN